MENLVLKGAGGQHVAFCPLEVVVRFLSGKWRPRIVWQLGKTDGWTRFGELKSAIPGITEKVLIGHLRELEKMDMLARHEYGSFPPKVEYRLSDFGRTILPLFESASDWVKANQDPVRRALGNDLNGSFNPCAD